MISIPETFTESLIDLPPLGDDGDERYNLQPLRPQFFIAPLSDKPQNPIMDTIKLYLQDDPHQRHVNHDITTPLQHGRNVDILGPLDELTTMWDQVYKDRIGRKLPSLFSWDMLRTSHVPTANYTPFVSEGTSEDFAIVRYHVQPQLVKDLKPGVTYVDESEILRSLKVTVFGMSSKLYTWNATSETFQPTSPQGNPSELLIYGKDEKTSASVVERFLTIGTLLRRIDILIESLKSKNRSDGSIVHAFTHSLSALLQYIRSKLAALPSQNTDMDYDRQLFIETWSRYAEIEDIATTVALLCRREATVSPRRYQPLPTSPEELLSHVYMHLKSLMERSADRIVKAGIAFILTIISQNYFKSVCSTVGLGRVDVSEPVSDALLDHAEDEEQEDVTDDERDEKTRVIQAATSFPVFFSAELAGAIPRARKSLELLKATQHDHPLLHSAEPSSQVRWFWRHDEIISAWDRTQHSMTQPEPQATDMPKDPAVSSVKYKEELQDFQVFDLPPGEGIQPETQLPVTSESSIGEFMTAFPSELPSITPTLDHLADVVLTPLLERTRLLSGALLKIFTSDTSYFNFHDHVYLLRSYLLLTLHSFRSRLETACFSDVEDRHNEKQAARSLVVKPSIPSEDANWAVGLAPGLMERQTWPPGGADLSFYLRTVIVDSLESRIDESDEVYTSAPSAESGRARIFQEADFRLGFAIRDLPAGTGRERWLNPLSIEALDFLYMEYRPPHPMDVLITPEVISKYQRMFAFLLRLMRVENAVRSLYRMTRRKSDPLFPTLASSNKLLLHFRFVAQSFVTVLATYVYDTAIRGNFDVLLSRLSSAATLDSESFPDVFALAEYHSSVMDDVLSASLLRSGQKAAGDLLRGCLEYVLDVSNLAGMLKENRREEYEAAPLLEDLYTSFNTRIAALVTVLRGVIEKEAAASDIPIEYMDMLSADKLAALRGVGSLRHLLHQLDKTHRSLQLQ
ncbi:hypothetical protein NEOLEDRAFT_1172809 [Neolentinus lepideus HHB14362 ss-1]|uniref:Spindle pole body component n=1 Tax=Neolentinus lepideus HHB14362 ss-1 TaxID=1314782 RepID=A0A165NNY9_9AGAM|nr:hypothetical protein NEOLEDRAFT_1172809 [Neolentinus lepideus HHB14362 ss-1]